MRKIYIPNGNRRLGVKKVLGNNSEKNAVWNGTNPDSSRNPIKDRPITDILSSTALMFQSSAGDITGEIAT
jgi:hypothetical protein